MSRATLVVLSAFSLLAQQHSNPAFRDTATIPSFRRHAPRMVHFTTLLRAPVNDSLDLLIIRGGAPSEGWRADEQDITWWAKDDLLGLFLRRRDDPGLVYELTIVPNTGFTVHLAVERVTPKEVVLSQTPEKGQRPDYLKFFFDPRTKSLLRQAEYPRFGAAGLVNMDGIPQFAMSNGHSLLFFLPAGAQGFEKAPELEWPAGIASVPSDIGGRIGDAAGPLRFGPGGHFSLEKINPLFDRRAPRVMERSGQGEKGYRLPQSSLDAWPKARPKSAQRFRPVEASQIQEEIGPHQVFEGRLWFGKTFYDSEGYTGIGGFGYFDPHQRSYTILSPPQIAGWSASALLVERDAVWLGLASRHEYGDSSGGLLRWDRAKQKVRRYPNLGIVRAIARHDGRLYLGTNEGLAILDAGALSRHMIDLELDGSFELVLRQPK